MTAFAPPQRRVEFMMPRPSPGPGRGLLRVVALTLAVLCSPSAQGRAQDTAPTRASEIEAARRAKAEALAEAEPPSKVERAFNFIEESRLFNRIFNPPRGWFAQVGGVGEGNGFTLGGGYRQPTPLGVFTARALGSMRQSHLASLEFTRAFLPREAGYVTASVWRRHEAAQRYYGTGPDTTFDDQTSFGLSGTQVDVTTGVRVTSWLTGTAGVAFANPDITESSESNRVPDTGDNYGEAETPGISFQPEYLLTHIGIIIDTRDTRNPRDGGYYLVQLRRFDDREGGAYSFTDTRIDLQQFVPFWNKSRVLALRALAHHADGLGQAQVPFYLMPTLGGARTLRGYDRQRFRDRSLILFSAEYRYEVNPFLMGAVFYDAGQVAPDWSDFRIKDFRDNYGVGLRFGYSNAVALRADLAFGGEDTIRFIVGFTTSF
jgi:hypothetical protein